MRKIVSILCLLVANAFLLAHTIIPHHHHDIAAVCIINTSCTDAEEDHGHHHNSESHQHEGQDSFNECTAYDAFIRQSNEQFSLIIDNHSLPLFCQLFLVNSIVKINEFEGLPFDYKPYLLSYHSQFLTHSLGLRAPPTC